jgi:acetyl esterase/lipase
MTLTRYLSFFLALCFAMEAAAAEPAKPASTAPRRIGRGTPPADDHPKLLLYGDKAAPGAMGETDADKAWIWIYQAPADKANGTAVVICPGGGYGGLAIGHEGNDSARWYNSLGVSAFVLKYRLSPYRHPVPLDDAQRAIRLVRAKADEWKVDKNRVGIMGFSAGGHLASTLATHFSEQGRTDAADEVDHLSSRPDFAVLCYPVITFTKEAVMHAGSRRNLLGDAPDPKLFELLSNELQVTERTPPTFLFHTGEDKGVPPENSVLFYEGLRKAKVPAELHIYERGPHGVGMAENDAILGTWTGRLKDWLLTRGLLK